ncbi:hypothetical protein QBC41DRAFT_102003 [Cercophora samala]|uniref:Uncharacterized protein n=1 Tax=Cercophora samala TaxID=330535 RepID=A0AA39ZEZ5_9PEZI|nr:hypothetical protein QBC41DRAFT_102003 [Cercophora samala]
MTHDGCVSHHRAVEQGLGKPPAVVVYQTSLAFNWVFEEGSRAAIRHYTKAREKHVMFSAPSERQAGDFHGKPASSGSEQLLAFLSSTRVDCVCIHCEGNTFSRQCIEQAPSVHTAQSQHEQTSMSRLGWPVHFGRHPDQQTAQPQSIKRAPKEPCPSPAPFPKGTLRQALSRRRRRRSTSPPRPPNHFPPIQHRISVYRARHSSLFDGFPPPPPTLRAAFTQRINFA